MGSLQAVLAAPTGVTRLMDMLGEKEALRNEALLLFMGLSRSNETIQQIAAFEGAFERLLSIIRSAFVLPCAYMHHESLWFICICSKSCSYAHTHTYTYDESQHYCQGQDHCQFRGSRSATPPGRG